MEGLGISETHETREQRELRLQEMQREVLALIDAVALAALVDAMGVRVAGEIVLARARESGERLKAALAKK